MPNSEWNSTTSLEEGAIVYLLAADNRGQYEIPFGNITPLASRAQHIHEAVHDFPRLNGALASAAFGRRDQGLDMTTHRPSDRWDNAACRDCI